MRSLPHERARDPRAIKVVHDESMGDGGFRCESRVGCGRAGCHGPDSGVRDFGPRVLRKFLVEVVAAGITGAVRASVDVHAARVCGLSRPAVATRVDARERVRKFLRVRQVALERNIAAHLSESGVRSLVPGGRTIACQSRAMHLQVALVVEVRCEPRSCDFTGRSCRQGCIKL